jgi:hypothetical protein
VGGLGLRTARCFPRVHAEREPARDADDAIDLFEWTLQRILLHDLEAHWGGSTGTAVRHQALRPLQAQSEVLFSTLVHAGHGMGTEPSGASAPRAETKVFSGGENAEVVWRVSWVFCRVTDGTAIA